MTFGTSCGAEKVNADKCELQRYGVWQPLAAVACTFSLGIFIEGKAVSVSSTLLLAVLLLLSIIETQSLCSEEHSWLFLANI